MIQFSQRLQPENGSNMARSFASDLNITQIFWGMFYICIYLLLLFFNLCLFCNTQSCDRLPLPPLFISAHEVFWSMHKLPFICRSELQVMQSLRQPIMSWFDKVCAVQTLLAGQKYRYTLREKGPLITQTSGFGVRKTPDSGWYC